MIAMIFVYSGCADQQSGEADVFEFEPEPYLPEVERIVSVPVYGGTMESAPEIGGVVAADPEGDRLLRLVGEDVFETDLGDNARPFRIHVEGARAWVTLRGRGELASVDLDHGSVAWSTRVCLEPRGIARLPDGPLVVACAGGELVEVDDNGTLLRVAILDTDLRDIVAADDVLLVSRFATGAVLRVDPTTLSEVSRTAASGVAWRMRPHERHTSWDDPWPEPGALVLRQVMDCETIELPGNDDGVDTGEEQPPAYGSAGDHPSCFGPIVATDLTFASKYGGSSRLFGLSGVTAATDFVITRQGDLAVANAGAGEDEGDVLRFQFSDVGFVSAKSPWEVVRLASCGRGSAVAMDDEGSLVVQTAAPFSLQRANTSAVVIEESPDELTEVVRLFQEQPGVGVSCASCHPEGLDDGQVWSFVVATDETPRPFFRRTMPLAGNILSRQPYHWDAALDDPHALMEDTFVQRMGGSVDPEATNALFEWLDGLRHVRAHPAAPESDIEIGRIAFATAGCDACHSGEAFTSNQVEYVGREGEMVKVPSLLGVGVRNALLHDGCHYDLRARLVGGCGMSGDTHGVLSQLTDDEIEALEAFLRTL